MSDGAIADAQEPPATWLTQRERGTVRAIRALAFWATIFGRRPARLVLRFVALFYAVFDRSVARASRGWLRRVHGNPPRFRDVYRHVFHFAQAALDRFFFLRGATGYFEVNRNGTHHLQELQRQGQGAILLGAHLGSFEAMRASGGASRLPIHIVGHFENAKMINAVLEKLDPEMAGRVIHVGRDPIGLALTLKERVAAGGLLAILADRVGLNDKKIEVNFFGEPAAFPTGPFLLAAALRCPVYLVFGLYFEPNRYEVSCEPFSERVVLPRGNREVALQDAVQRYATRLEEKCREAPNNWFNFYNFWE